MIRPLVRARGRIVPSEEYFPPRCRCAPSRSTDRPRDGAGVPFHRVFRAQPEHIPGNPGLQKPLVVTLLDEHVLHLGRPTGGHRNEHIVPFADGGAVAFSSKSIRLHLGFQKWRIRNFHKRLQRICCLGLQFESRFCLLLLR